MVNYDAQDGYSVSSFQSPILPRVGHGSRGAGAAAATAASEPHHHAPIATDTSLDPFTAAALSLPPTSIGTNGLQLQSQLLAPSTSILTIREVHFKHAGNYSCAPSNARMGTITIHVLRGKPLIASYISHLSQVFCSLLFLPPSASSPPPPLDN